MRDVFHIHKRQRVHRSAYQVITAQYNQLVVDILVPCVHAKALHQHCIAAHTAAILLDDEGAGSQVCLHYALVLQISQRESNNACYYKQIPIADNAEDPLHYIEVRLLFLYCISVLRYVILCHNYLYFSLLFTRCRGYNSAPSPIAIPNWLSIQGMRCNWLACRNCPCHGLRISGHWDRHSSTWNR